MDSVKRPSAAWIGLCAAAFGIAACSTSGQVVEQRQGAVVDWQFLTSVRPSDTDGVPGSALCGPLGTLPDPALGQIGCPQWSDKIDGLEIPGALGDFANDSLHYLYVPSTSSGDSMLLVLLGGGDGTAPDASDGFSDIYQVAASQGYHVIGLTYPAGHTNSCGPNLRCYGDFSTDTITGHCPRAGADGCTHTTIDQHPQDSIVNRLVMALKWAAAHYPSFGWQRYLTADGEPDWLKIRVMGHSGGASHAAQMGLLFPGISRVALLASPNDGRGPDEADWTPATYLDLDNPVPVGRRYFGLVHELNHAVAGDTPLFETTQDWEALGMAEEGGNPPPTWFDPQYPGYMGPPTFGGAHMLVSIDSATTMCEAHGSVLTNRYKYVADAANGCETHCDGENLDSLLVCNPELPWAGTRIGYEPAWRCLLGSGDSSPDVNHPPTVSAGPNQTVLCQGHGLAVALLQGTAVDPDCDVLDLEWSSANGRFGATATAAVILPVGPHPLTFTATDWAGHSVQDRVKVTVVDRPTVKVTVTPNVLPPDGSLVRVTADVTATDTCDDDGPLTIKLQSITANEPLSADGVQGDDTGTDDRAFRLRAERTSIGGRVYTIEYTATDAQGNTGSGSATAIVPLSIITPGSSSSLAVPQLVSPPR
jgi:hypothetical protein